ncbi:MAG TPA: hypothetical protein VMX96_08770 [Dehalococcoidia bacterium]|nr:hypothetical protein [Dehalococcoidia bacterium]
MMQRFTLHVKLYALDERRSGKPWKEVQKSIKEKFNTDPPSIRAMEKWEKGIDRDKLSQMIIEESRKTLPTIEEASLQQMASGLIPVLWKARDAGEDMELEAWLWFFKIIERQLGEAKFEYFFSKYQGRKSAAGV